MKTIQKQTLAIALISTFLLIGCGGGSSSSPTPETQVDDSSNLSSSKNGILTYKNLEWQDNEAIKDGSEYAYRNDYCSALTLGEHYDWRLPSSAEFEELYAVKSNLKTLWSTDTVDIYWTKHNTSTHVSVYNLAVGKGGLFIIDRVGSTKWGISCLRDVKIGEK
jgi:hypothetical protein